MNPILSQDQISNINKYQSLGFFHPLTCNNGHILSACDSGLICDICGYTQSWVPNVILDYKHSGVPYHERFLRLATLKKLINKL